MTEIACFLCCRFRFWLKGRCGWEHESFSRKKKGEYGRLIYEIDDMKIGHMKEVDVKAVDILFSTGLLLPFISTLFANGPHTTFQCVEKGV